MSDDTTWFWKIVDARGLADVSSDEFVALNELISKAERAEAAEAALTAAEAERDRLQRRVERLTDSTVMVMVNGAGFAAPKPVAQHLADLVIKLDQARNLGMAYSADAKAAEGALATIRRRAIFGPSITTSDLLDLTASVAGLSPETRLCPHAPTYDAGLCCGHPDDCTFVSPAALSTAKERGDA